MIIQNTGMISEKFCFEGGQTAEKLWEALTSGEFTKKYFFGQRVESKWKVGSPITYWENETTVDIQGKILECDPQRRLSFTFTGVHDTFKRERSTRVTFEIKPVGGIVKLTLTHEYLISQDLEADPNTLRGLNNGWPAILSNLKSFLETGKSFDLLKPDAGEEKERLGC